MKLKDLEQLMLEYALRNLPPKFEEIRDQITNASVDFTPGYDFQYSSWTSDSTDGVIEVDLYNDKKSLGNYEISTCGKNIDLRSFLLDLFGVEDE